MGAAKLPAVTAHLMRFAGYPKMNAPSPVPVAGTNVAPSAGSLIGAAAGLAAASKLGLNPFDPATGGALVATVTTLITALFHWLGKKSGVVGLG